MFKYEIISCCFEVSYYMIDLLKIHGLYYNWAPISRNDMGNTIHIKISDYHNKEIFGLIFSTRSIDSWYEINIASEIQLDWYKLFFNKKDFLEFPTWNSCVYPINVNEIDIDIEQLCYIKNNQNHHCIGILSNSRKQVLLSIDIVKYLEYSLLGIESLNKSEDWCEINGFFKTHKNETNAFVDDIMVLIRTILMKYCPNAMPVYIDYYPKGKTAPFIITGDSDESTFDDITGYFEYLDKFNCKSCLLVKDTEILNKHKLFKLNYKRQSFGIHPFSQNRNIREYLHNIQKLHKYLKNNFDSNYSYAVRNHLFQNINARKQLVIERGINIQFDMNSVLANNNSWIGTGSGVGIPIPYPPINNGYNINPLHFTTVIEDDVLLFDYQYCYKPFINDQYSTNNLILNFLNEWLLKKNKPAQANLHPQNSNEILCLIIDWITQNHIWNPNLNEYHQWLLERATTTIHVFSDYKYEVETKSSRIDLFII